jgi:ElaB/YqjD/DUF883 family membrane-anchored ribosome-binding protein
MKKLWEKYFSKAKQVIGCANCECTVQCGAWKKVIISGVVGVIIGAIIVYELMG